MQTQARTKQTTDEALREDEKTNEEENKSHKICPLCNPEITLDGTTMVVTLCGKTLVNRKRRFGLTPTCDECKRLMKVHLKFSHFWKHRPQKKK